MQGTIEYRVDSRFAPSQWETALFCNDVSRWLGASLESALIISVYPDSFSDEWVLIRTYLFMRSAYAYMLGFRCFVKWVNTWPAVFLDVDIVWHTRQWSKSVIRHWICKYLHTYIHSAKTKLITICRKSVLSSEWHASLWNTKIEF